MTQASSSGPRASILLVDDLPANLHALEAILAPLGQELVRAGSGEEALRLLLRRDFALIVMDVRMPGLDGIETAGLIRQRERSESTPIIFVTAFDGAGEEVTRAYGTVGAADFVFKPVVPEVLRSKVAVFVELFQKSEQIRLQSLRLRRMEEREHSRRLREAESLQQRAEDRFARVLEASPDAIVVLDAEERVVLFNQGAEAVFGWTAAEVKGEPLAVLLGPGEIVQDGDQGRHEITGRRRDGSTFPAEASLSRIESLGEVSFALIVRDVTDRRRVMEQVKRMNAELTERLKSGIALVADVASSLDPGEVTERMLARSLEAVAADAGVLIREREGGLVVAGSRAAGALPVGSPFLSSDVETALELDRPILNGRLAGLAEVQRTAVLPLLVRPGERAALVLGRREDRPFDVGDLEMLRLISGVAAVSLRNAELFHEAEAASRSKGEFLNLAAHELRTPLSVVTGYVSMLVDGTFGDAPERFGRPLEILNSKASELNKLVDDLLLAARMEGGLIPRNVEAFDLRLAAQEAVGRAEPQAALLGAELACDVPAAPVLVRADLDHVGRILDNLVNNALVYSKGRPWIRVSVRPEGAAAVEDHGVGIPHDRQELVFERFWRGNDVDFMAQPGTGLGLYLSRELARSLKGDLVLEESKPGSGSRFALSLPPIEPALTVPEGSLKESA